MFVGRKNELKLLSDAYRSGKDELVVLYGRRRIGKSSLVKCFARVKKFYYEFEALEGETTHGQIDHFLATNLKRDTFRHFCSIAIPKSSEI